MYLQLPLILRIAPVLNSKRHTVRTLSLERVAGTQLTITSGQLRSCRTGRRAGAEV